MEEAFKVMHLNRLIRMAVNLVRGLELEIGEDYFDMAVCSVVSWFKVSQQNSFGESVCMQQVVCMHRLMGLYRRSDQT